MKMKTRKLIDANDLYTLFVKMKSFGELTAKKAIRCVEEAPTVDAEPVRHGKWIYRNPRVDIATCSCCGDRWGSISVMNYCPYCGAKMDGGENDKTD